MRNVPTPEEMIARAELTLGDRWDTLQTLGASAHGLGFTAWAGGGIPRDLLIGQPISDLDVVGEGDAGALAMAVSRAHGGEVLVHAPFLTACWTTGDGHKVDVATARAESYPAPAQLPAVQRTDLLTDLCRRDFTINAIALSLSPESLGSLQYSPGALKDLEAGLLKIHHPNSFLDDPTRAWRAARYAARLRFSLHPATRQALQKTVAQGGLSALGAERMGAEMEAIFREPRVSHALRLLEEWHVLTALHPDVHATPEFIAQLNNVQEALEHHRNQGWPCPRIEEAIWLLVGGLVPQRDREAISAMVPGDKKQRTRFVEGPRRVREILAGLRTAGSRKETGRVLVSMEPAIRMVAWSQAADPGIREQLTWWEQKGHSTTASINGQRLLDLGHSPGPALRIALETAQDVAWDGGDDEDQLEAALDVLEGLLSR